MQPWTPTTDVVLLRRYGKTLEELGELVAVAARCIIQGINEVDPSSGKTNRLRLEQEIADVQTQCDLTITTLGLDQPGIVARRMEKARQMIEWESLFVEADIDRPYSPALQALLDKHRKDRS